MALTPLQIKTQASRKSLKSGEIEGAGINFKGKPTAVLSHDLEPGWTDLKKKEEGAIRTAAEYFDGNTWIAYLLDVLFDGLDEKDREWWYTTFADAVASRKRPWSEILHVVHIAILSVALRSGGKSSKLIQDVIDLHARALAGDMPSLKEWRDASATASRRARSNFREYRPASRTALLAAMESATWQMPKRTDPAPSAWAAAWYAARSERWRTGDEAELPKAYLEIAQAVISELERTP